MHFVHGNELKTILLFLNPSECEIVFNDNERCECNPNLSKNLERRRRYSASLRIYNGYMTMLVVRDHGDPITYRIQYLSKFRMKIMNSNTQTIFEISNGVCVTQE